MSYLFLRLLLLGLIAWLGFKLFRKFIAPTATQQQPGQFETMVSCSHCGLHLPQRESVSKNGRHYCCQAHADQADTGSPE